MAELKQKHQHSVSFLISEVNLDLDFNVNIEFYLKSLSIRKQVQCQHFFFVDECRAKIEK